LEKNRVLNHARYGTRLVERIASRAILPPPWADSGLIDRLYD